MYGAYWTSLACLRNYPESVAYTVALGIQQKQIKSFSLTLWFGFVVAKNKTVSLTDTPTSTIITAFQTNYIWRVLIIN